MLIAAALLLPLCAPALAAQTAGSSAPADNGAFDMTDFPDWTKDLRRAEIVAFGSFPFTLFLASFAVDMNRASQHDWSSLYWPWPFKPAGAVERTTDEHWLILGSAAGGAVLVALADFLIVQIKRSNREKALQQLPQGDPIIIRKPADGGEPGAGASEAE